MDEPTKELNLAGRDYLGKRVTDQASMVGYIRIDDPISGEPVARVTHNGSDGAMTLTTYGQPLDRAVVDALFQRADRNLA